MSYPHLCHSDSLMFHFNLGRQKCKEKMIRGVLDKYAFTC